MERHLKRLTQLICVWTPDGRLSACNDAYCQFLGVPAEQLIGKRWVDLLPPDHREKAINFIEDFVANPRPYQDERQVRHASGEIRWLDWISQPITDASGKLCEVLSEGRDITERKRAEQEARESERRYHRLFEEAIEGMVVADLETGLIEDCNEAFQRLTGFNRAELLARPLPVTGVDDPGPAAFVARLARAGDGAHAVLPARIVTKGGGIRDVEVKGSALQMAGRNLVHAFFHDLTPERLAERFRDATLVLLRMLNEEDQSRELLRQITDLLRVWTGCDAVGVRLREGEDFPFFETRGFSSEFLRNEGSLCSHDPEGRPALDHDGRPLLDCLCGRVLTGRVERGSEWISGRGSFWTNSTSSLNGNSPMTRGRCLEEGYESMAMIPLRHGDQVLGLLHLTDRAPGRFSDAVIGFLENAGDQIAIALAQKAKLSSLEGGLRQIAALLADIGVGSREERPPLPPALRAALTSLSRRETEVLRLLLQNRRPATIAKELSRSIHTVRNQLKAIFRKLNVHSQEELLGRLGSNADLLEARTLEARGRTRRPDKACTSTRNCGHVRLSARMAGVARSALSPEGANTSPYLRIEGLTFRPARSPLSVRRFPFSVPHFPVSPVPLLRTASGCVRRTHRGWPPRRGGVPSPVLRAEFSICRHSPRECADIAHAFSPPADSPDRCRARCPLNSAGPPAPGRGAAWGGPPPLRKGRERHREEGLWFRGNPPSGCDRHRVGPVARPRPHRRQGRR